MRTIDAAQWKILSPYLEEALAITEAGRPAWLGALRIEHPTLAGQVETLLQEHGLLEEEGFLEKRAAPLPRGQPFAGLEIEPYTLVEEIGHGGMGSVWLAERSDGRFERQVAIKFLNFGFMGKGAEQRFKREARILARLAHPHIAELIDASVASAGQPYLVLEYVEGDHIDRYCDSRGLEVVQRIRLFLDVLAAVSHAHSSLIVHCDIKPSNVLVRNDGKVKLLDFGIAKLLADEADGEAATLLTVEAVRPMTPEFAAPEQLQGSAVTTRTDVYALGALLYSLLTGQHPAGSGRRSPADLIKAVVEKEAARPSEVVAKTETDSEAAASNAARRGSTPDKLQRLLRGDLDTILAKALKKDPAERYLTVAALADDLRRYLRQQPIAARADTITYRATKFVRRNCVPVALSALFLAATLAGGAGTLLQARTARKQRDFAFRQLVRAERIAGLNELLLTDAAPIGKPLKANELLEREEHIVQREHYEDAASHVEMLISIGSQYSGEGEIATAQRVLEQAYSLSQGLREPSTRAKAGCELAWAIVPTDLGRAEKLVQQSLSELPDEPQFDPVRVQCLVRGADIAWRRGDADQVIARAKGAEHALQDSPVRPPMEELDVLTVLAGGYAATGQFREANAAYERASARMTDLGYDETQKAVKLFNDWGLALSDAGRPLEAERAYRRAIEISKSNLTEDAVLPALLHNYSGVLRDLGRLTEAADYERRAQQEALAAGDQLLAAQTLLQMGRIYRDQHDFQNANVVFAELEPKMRSKLPSGHFAFAILASDRSLLERAEGKLSPALTLANEAVELDEAAIKAGGQGRSFLPAFLYRRSALELEAGNQSQAVADAARAIALLNGIMQPGSLSSSKGRAHLALGRALQAEGKADGARSAFRSAAENLQAALGPEHNDTRIAKRLADGDSIQTAALGH